MHLSDANHFRKPVAGACMVIAAGVVGLELIGRMVWLESNEAWDHTAEHEGFRPMLGMR
jgi:hypothetical protein